jgi:hypothetical protein
MLRCAAATASNGALRRPVMSTRAPFSAKASAAERPMPELPPVMMTTGFSYGLIVPHRTLADDISFSAAETLGIAGRGVAKVKLDVVQ